MLSVERRVIKEQLTRANISIERTVQFVPIRAPLRFFFCFCIFSLSLSFSSSMRNNKSRIHRGSGRKRRLLLLRKEKEKKKRASVNFLSLPTVFVLFCFLQFSADLFGLRDRRSRV